MKRYRECPPINQQNRASEKYLPLLRLLNISSYQDIDTLHNLDLYY